MENSTFPHRIGIASLGPNNPVRDLQNTTTQMAAAFEGTGTQKNGINTFKKKYLLFLGLEVLGFKFKPGGLQAALSGQWNVLFVGMNSLTGARNWGFTRLCQAQREGLSLTSPGPAIYRTLWKTDSLEGLS